MAREMSAEEIRELLSSQYVARIGCRRGDELYVVPIAYVLDSDSVLVFSYEGRKLEMMRANPRVCFEVDRVEHLGHWSSLIAWGRFEELSGEDRELAKRRLAARLEPELRDDTSRKRLARAMADDPAPVVFRIILDEITGRSEGAPS